MQFYLKPLAAVLTFLTGTFAVYLAPLPNIQVAHDARYDEVYSVPETVSLCELEKHPERYNGKTVRVRAWIDTDEYGVLIFDHQMCGTEPVRVSCRAGYASCAGLLEDLRLSRTDRAQVYADGHFYAAVLEHQASRKADSMVPLFQIAETRGLKLEGVRETVYEGSFEGGRGTGHGQGWGYGSGSGSGKGTGMEAAAVRGENDPLNLLIH